MRKPYAPLDAALLVWLPVADATPPYDPPRADVAPELLQRFIYNLTRDWVPVGVVEAALSKARSETYPLTGKHAEMAEDVARQLVYEG